MISSINTYILKTTYLLAFISIKKKKKTKVKTF